jgi:hypothetical protein
MAKPNNPNNRFPTFGVNTFTGGMNKDISKTSAQPNMYYDGSNVRIVAHHEKESAALVNVEGNKFSIKIPPAPNVFEITNTEPGATWTDGFPNAVVSITMLNAEGQEETYGLMMDSGTGSKVRAIYDLIVNPDTQWQTGTDEDLNPIYNPLPSELQYYFDFDTETLLIWGLVSITTGGQTDVITLATNANDLQVIGHTTIRDDIYLFTTSPHEEDGQIWRLTYDKSTLETNIECVYARDFCINFRLEHPIQAIGRYENAGTQNIYFTDFNNPPRKINVAKENAMALRCAFLDIAPKIALDIPILKKIEPAGQLPGGIYQLSYRYKNDEGIVTNWSPLSNLVPLTSDSNPENNSSSACEIEGVEWDVATNANSLTTNAIRWQISNIDLSYSYLEVAAVYRPNENAIDADIYIFNEFVISNNTQDIILFGTEEKIIVSFSEFISGTGISFEKVKTISSKDNKLFLGNVVNVPWNVDFDARAYRFKRDGANFPSVWSSLDSLGGDILTINGEMPTGSDQDPDWQNWNTIPTEHDTINPYNDENLDSNPDWLTTDQYKWQADGQTLGGQGPNVSYQFITKDTYPDYIDGWGTDETEYFENNVISHYCASPLWPEWAGEDANTPTLWNQSWTSPFPNAACFVNPIETNNLDADGFQDFPDALWPQNNVSLGVENQTYDLYGGDPTLKNPYAWSLYKGYARGEIYRFGIVFYNNKGSASFVNWIGDIKFPFRYDHAVNMYYEEYTGTENPTSFANDEGTPGDTANPVPPFVTFFMPRENLDQYESYLGVSGDYEVQGGEDSMFGFFNMRMNNVLVCRQLGIEFTVDLSSLNIAEEGITGFSIVRAKREDNDKTRLGEALGWPVTKIQPNGNYVDTSGAQGTVAPYVYSEDSFLAPLTQFPHPNFSYPLLIGVGTPGGDADALGYHGHRFMDEGCGGTRAVTHFINAPELKTFLLYGPLFWINSNPDKINTYSKPSDVRAGDYIKLANVVYPYSNADVGTPEVMNNCATCTGDATCSGISPLQYCNQFGEDMGDSDVEFFHSTESWDKYYYPITSKFDNSGYSDLKVKTGALNINYPYSVNPANNRTLLEWGMHIKDGEVIQSTIDPSLDNDFRNVAGWSNWWIAPVTVSGEGGTVAQDACIDLAYGHASRPRSMGSEALLVTTQQDIPYYNYFMGGNNDPDERYMYRPIFSYERYGFPYGGGSYSARSFTQYMFCGHYVPLTENTDTSQPLTHDIWGGDVFVGVYDYTQFERNMGQGDNDYLSETTFQDYTGYSDDLVDLIVPDSGYTKRNGVMVPLEMHLDINYRGGYHYANKDLDTDSIELHDEYELNRAYLAKNDVRTFFALGIGMDLNEEFDTRIYYSGTKINGERTDQWTVFKADNYKDLEGIYGPLNNLMILKDNMYFFQDKAFGALTINPNAIVQAQNGMDIQLGTVSGEAGAFISHYDYISEQFGSKQQWAMTKSDSAIYFFDILQKKMFKFSGQGNQPLSDVKGLNGYFQDNLLGDILKDDNPFLNKGITATFDSRHYEALFTFHDSQSQIPVDYIIIDWFYASGNTTYIARPVNTCNECPTPDESTSGIWNVEDVYWLNPDGNTLTSGLTIQGDEVNSNIYAALIVNYAFWSSGNYGYGNDQLQPGDVLIQLSWEGGIDGVGSGYGIVGVPYEEYGEAQQAHLANLDAIDQYVYPEIGDIIQRLCPYKNSFTVAFNEFADAYTSFYSFTPSIYINDGHRIFSPNCTLDCHYDDNAFRRDNLYLHDVGTYGTFYDLVYPSSVEFVTNTVPSYTKTFDNAVFYMETYRVTEESVFNYQVSVRDPFKEVRYTNNYQSSGWIDLIPGDNVRDIEGSWQMIVPRNVINTDIQNPDVFNDALYDPSRLFKERLRDKYIMTELIYDNFDDVTGASKNIKFLLYYFQVHFRASFR